MVKKEVNKPKSLLLIGIVLFVIVVAIVLFFLLKTKYNNSFKNNIEKQELDMKIESVKLEEESAQVNLRIDPKEEKIVGIKFILETDESYEVFKEDVSISKITEKKFTFKLKEINGKKITRISVSPIFENKKGEEVLGSVKDDYFIEASNNEENNSENFYEDYNDYDYYEYYEQEYSDEYSEYWNYENETSLSNETNNNQNNNSNNNQTNYSNINYPNENISFCGDNIINVGEYCDSNNFAGETCESLGYASGILGCRKTCEFDTRYCVAKTPINNSPPVNNTPPVNCVSYSYSQCYNNDVYWYNSCGVRESVKEDCFSDEDCIDGECVIKQTTPVCNSNSYFQCYNGDVYWYNSCGVRETIREDCTSSETCTNNSCVNNPTNKSNITIIYQNDFENQHTGLYHNLSDFLQDWNTKSGGDRWYKAEVISGIFGNPTQVLKIEYPFYDSSDFGYTCQGDNKCYDKRGERIVFANKPSFGTSQFMNGVNLGVQWKTNIPGNHKELYLSYKIKFKEGFYPVDGGKLPGFCGGTCTSGGSNTDVNRDGTSDGFSARLMFEKASKGYPISLRFYVYHPDRPNTTKSTGDSVIFSKGVNDGEWHTIVQHVVMNDLNVKNGILEAWLDGELVARRTDFNFRQGSSANFDIDYLYFSTFFGGNKYRNCTDSQVSSGEYQCSTYSDGTNYYFYAPRKDENIYFDDIIIYNK